MAWQDEMGELLRVMVVDLGDTPKNSDDTIERVLVGAAMIVAGELRFSQDFQADLSNRDIVPDPTDSDGGTRDVSFINLVCMRAAAIVDQGTVRSESGIVIRDNGSMVDLHYKLQAALALVKNGWQKAYDDLKLEYQAGQLDGTVAGQAVLGPFRDVASVFWGWGDGETSRSYRDY